MSKDICTGVPIGAASLVVLSLAVSGNVVGDLNNQPYRSVFNPYQTRFFHFDDPASYQAGNVYITPTLYVEGGVDDNLLSSNDNSDDPLAIEPIETPYLNTDAYVEAALKDRHNSYALSYRNLTGTYTDSDPDDFMDHQLVLDMYIEANSKNAFNIYGEYFLTHEARGTGYSEGAVAQLQDEPFKYSNALLGLQYTLGNKSSTGRMELEASYFARNWDSQELEFFDEETQEIAQIDVTESRNYNVGRFRGAFYYKVAPKTELLLEGRVGSYGYETPPPGEETLDSQELYGLIGVAWAATSKTYGTAKIGMFSKDFDADTRDEFSSVTWDIRFLWSPLDYSDLHLTIRRFPQEMQGTGSFIDTQQYAVGWQHAWLERFSTGIDVDFFNNTYEQSEQLDGEVREDDLLFVTLRADYDVLRWLSLGAGYRYQTRQSTEELLEYNRNRLFLSIAMSM